MEPSQIIPSVHQLYQGIKVGSVVCMYVYVYTVEPLNNGHGGDEHFVHCSDVVPSSEVEIYGQLMAGGKLFVHCREVVLLSECPLSEVLLYT